MPFDHEQPSIAELPIAAIRVEGRFRREMGDIASFAVSIAEVGLLHPIVVTPDHLLIAGERRLHAIRKLGRTHVPVRIVLLADIFGGEFDEMWFGLLPAHYATQSCSSGGCSTGNERVLADKKTRTELGLGRRRSMHDAYNCGREHISAGLYRCLTGCGIRCGTLDCALWFVDRGDD